MHLLPRPKELHRSEGSFSLTYTARLVLSPTARQAMTAARLLKSDLERFAGIRAELLCGTAAAGDILLSVGSGEGEGYSMTVSEAGIRIEGDSDAGLFYGVQTLRQLLRQHGAVLPCLTIRDEPVFAHRGFYHDCTRGRTPTLSWLKQLADEAALYKLNQLQLYVEHTYCFEAATEMWSAGEALTAQEIMELDEYCAQRHIELVPSLSSFGHLFELLNTKTWCRLCELPEAGSMPSTMPYRMAHHTLDISNPEALSLVEKLLKEFMPLFRSRRFNICADETFDLGKGRGKAAMEAVGEGTYYIGFVEKLCRIISESGRQPMFWGDIVVMHPEALTRLPEDSICLNWGYSPNVEETSTRLLAQAGAVQYVCPGVSGWNRIMNRIPDSYENISRMAAYGRRYSAIGLLNTDWGDYGHINDPRFSLPGMIMGAHFGWSAEELPFERFCEDISRLAYLDASGRCVGLLASLQSTDVCSWWQLVQYREHALGRADEGHGDTLAGLDSAAIHAANERIGKVERELPGLAAHMAPSARCMPGLWQLACEGIKVWNLVGEAVHLCRRDAALAERLERWLRHYEQQWHQVSKPSELWRIREMTRWYAEQLRTF